MLALLPRKTAWHVVRRYRLYCPRDYETEEYNDSASFPFSLFRTPLSFVHCCTTLSYTNKTSPPLIIAHTQARKRFVKMSGLSDSCAAATEIVFDPMEARRKKSLTYQC